MELEPRIVRSRVCSEKDSWIRMPSLEAFSLRALRLRPDISTMMISGYRRSIYHTKLNNLNSSYDKGSLFRYLKLDNHRIKAPATPGKYHFPSAHPTCRSEVKTAISHEFNDTR